MALGLVMIVVAGVLPAGSAQGIGVGGQTAFGVAPSPLPNGQARPYFTLSVAPGRSAGDTAVITNRGSDTVTLKLSPSVGTTAVNSGSSYTGSFKPCVGTACWVNGFPPTVTLAPDATRTLPFTVTVPSGTRPGQYLAGITAEPNTPPPSVVVGSNGHASARAVIVEQVTVGVALNVGDPSTFTSRLRITTVTAGAVASMPRLFVHTHNVGQTFLKGNGTVACTNTGKQFTYPVASDTVLPSEGAALSVNAAGLTFGTVAHCTVVVTYAPGLTATWTGDVALPPAVTLPKTVHSGPGIYSQVPSQGIPIWAIVLIGLGALLVILAVVVIILVRRRRPGPAS